MSPTILLRRRFAQAAGSAAPVLGELLDDAVDGVVGTVVVVVVGIVVVVVVVVGAVTVVEVGVVVIVGVVVVVEELVVVVSGALPMRMITSDPAAACSPAAGDCETTSPTEPLFTSTSTSSTRGTKPAASSACAAAGSG